MLILSCKKLTMSEAAILIAAKDNHAYSKIVDILRECEYRGSTFDTDADSIIKLINEGYYTLLVIDLDMLIEFKKRHKLNDILEALAENKIELGVYLEG